MEKHRKAIYPGSFDPITNGHLDVIERSLTIFDEIEVSVIKNPSKKALFSTRERVEMIKSALKNYKGVKVSSFDGLLVEYAKKMGANTIIRGLRAVSDFEYEFQMALMNRRMAPEIKSVYLMPSPEFTFLSSSLIKEVCSLGGNIKDLVPETVEKNLLEKL